MNREVKIGLIAASLIGGMAAGTAFAHEGDEQKQKVVIITERGHHDGDGQASIERDHARIMVADCGDGAKTDFSGGAEEKGKKTKILICSHGNASPEERAKRLEQAIERVNKNEELSAESKARITTALRDAIAQINAPAH